MDFKAKDILIARDSKGKCRVVNISCDKNKSGAYVISRSSGLFNGKLTNQPELIITKGKAKRTPEEQAILEYNSNVKKYLDKGYKKINDLGIVALTEKEIKEKLPNTNTDQNGNKKPMLCKVLDKTDKKLTEKSWLSSYKHDGVRCLLFWKDGEIHTSSRGGQNYDIPATYIRKDPFICRLLSENDDLILDGELYKHGWNLNKISGLCRKETLEEDHKKLKFHCYDIVDENRAFKFRAIELGRIQRECPNDSRLVIVNHIPVQGLEQIMNQHNKAVSEGYEGLVIRDPEMPYKCGARDNRMLKIKEFSDGEFKILGLVEGLREEDMCFLMETTEGYQFKAKPIGTREDKQWYREHINEIIGKLGTIKYFGMTNTECPVPNLPVFKSLRTATDL